MDEVWAALGISTYEQAQGRHIAEIVRELNMEVHRLREAATAPAPATPAREAFRAGFVANIDQATAVQRVQADEPYGWTFDGAVNSDLEPQAWDAYVKLQKGQPT